MSRTTLRNVGIIVLVALAVAVIPGGSATAELLLAIISLCFLAAIGFLGYRLYMEHKFTLWSMSDQHRALLYGGVTVATGDADRQRPAVQQRARHDPVVLAAGRLGVRRLSRLGRVPALPDLGPTSARLL